MRPSIERANEQLDPRQQLANTPPPQSTTPGLHPVSIIIMSQNGVDEFHEMFEEPLYQT